MQIHINVTIRGIWEYIPTYGRSSPSNDGKTMSFLPLMTGNGFYIAPKIGDWGIVNMTLFYPHKIRNMT